MNDVRVLIVDDQLAFRAAARMVVEVAEGFSVVGEAETGEEAVELAGELHPDLVLMDVNLPGIDGLAATRSILDSRPGTVVLVVSTYEEYANPALREGAFAFIQKSDLTPQRLQESWEAASSH